MASFSASIKVWRADDQHTGIGKLRGIPYTYRHLSEQPVPRVEIYRIETFIPFLAPTPLHGNVYYVPGTQLNSFLDDLCECAEIVIDVRPLTTNEALEELRAFQLRK